MARLLKGKGYLVSQATPFSIYFRFALSEKGLRAKQKYTEKGVGLRD